MNPRSAQRSAAQSPREVPSAAGATGLERAKARPRVVEEAVRSALCDAVAWRIGGGAAPSVSAFTTAAIAAGRLCLDSGGAADPAERARTLRAVAWAAGRFARSALCRRIMSVPPTRFVRLPRGPQRPDVLVRDARGKLHAVVITARSDGLTAARIATATAAATPLPHTQLLVPLTVHVFALATGVRHTCTRDIGRDEGPLRQTRVA